MFEECQKKKTQQKTYTLQTGLGQLTIPPANAVIQRTTAGHDRAPQTVRGILQQVDIELIEAVVYSLIPSEIFSEERVKKYIHDQIELIEHLETIGHLDVMTQAGEFYMESPERFAETVGGVVAHRIIQEEKLTAARDQVLLDELRDTQGNQEKLYQQKLTKLKLASHTNTPQARAAAKKSRDRLLQGAQKHFSERTDYLHHPQREQTNPAELYRSDKYFYHATPMANLESIKSTGLDPGHGGNGGITQLTGKMQEYGERCRGKIHLTDFLSTAGAYAYDRVTSDDTTEKIILRFPQAFLANEQLDIDPDEKDTAFTTSVRIPPELIETATVKEEKDEYGMITKRTLSWKPLLDR